MTPDKTKISQPFANIHYNENTGTQKLIEWMKRINADKGLGFGDIVFDTSSDVDRRRPDALIYEEPKSKKILCLIEFKKPEEEHTRLDVIDKAQREAKYRASPYFATSNFRELVWFDTKDKHQIDWFTLSAIETLDRIEDITYKSQITRGLEKFLINLYEIHTGKAPKPKRNLDEVLRYILHQKVDFLANNYTPIIRDRVHKDKTFAKDLRKWFAEQSWERSDDPEQDYRKTAYQAAYLLINKIIFYDVLQAKNPNVFNKLEIPDSFTKGGLLAGHLQNYFNQVLKVDYETIYTTDFIDQIAFPEHRDVVDTIKDLVNFLDRYDFAKIGVDIIGRIFEGLIPAKERHNLGQFFTNPDIVDIILRFCMKNEKDKVFDPSCGTGTFLVRAYQHKKLMNRRLGHEDILKTLWGTDIAKFPAHLATINLAINDLGVEENYPYILRDDFFNLTLGGSKYKQYDKSRMREVKGLGKAKITIPYPATVDCIVGNPPYTRQEEIPTTGVNKAQLINNALLDINNVPLAKLSKRAGIHAYFFVHGFKFLNNGGRFGFIVSNSWLDVDYGKGLQEFFLKHAKVVAIIESKVERWFADADINTCIVILEKASGEKLSKERDNNLVRFVQLNKKLSELNIPPISDIWERQKARLDAIDGLIKTILGHNEYYENDEMRIYPKSQKELWAEGFDQETNTYIGAKWGKYIRAPQIFFEILRKGKDKLVPLKEVADVRFGIKTGANEFFYLTEAEIKHWKIEKEFWMHKEGDKWVPNYSKERICLSILSGVNGRNSIPGQPVQAEVSDGMS
ncbi:SAM-dependent DNA methyltransferase [Candidatus Woesearchaeota archaeon]|nr:SAM-dependent DNA methyltransferase [Candidatus Woesearchaeota archaeon]